MSQTRSEMVALNADVVGYSRLIADDLEGVTATIDEYRGLAGLRSRVAWPRSTSPGPRSCCGSGPRSSGKRRSSRSTQPGSRWPLVPDETAQGGRLLDVRPAAECGLDALALGEVMLRLDPGELRIRTARSFSVWAGGGEYNVVRGLRRTFGLRTGIVTALVDNEVGRLVEDFILQGGVDTSSLRWLPFDGVGRRARNGLNFTERGFGVRGGLGVSDRGHTAASQLKPGDVDWESIFGRTGVRWFHTGGIFAGLSETTPAVIEEAIEAARRHGTVISYDLNYRPSLWNAAGGRAAAQAVNRRLAGLVDVLIGNEEDFTACLGIEVPGVRNDLAALSPEGYEAMLAEVVSEFPRVRIAAATLRTVRSASVNGWSAIAWADGRAHRAVDRPDLEVLDRVGGGDSFVAGLVYGLMERPDLAAAVEYGAAHGALAMTTPGDTSMATLAEVERLVRGAGARIRR